MVDCTFSVNLATMTAGCILGWTSPVLPKLEQPDSFIHITSEQGSWIGSLLSLGAIVGPFLGGYLANKIGMCNKCVTYRNFEFAFREITGFPSNLLAREKKALVAVRYIFVILCKNVFHHNNVHLVKHTGIHQYI